MMEERLFLSSKSNPRNLGFVLEHGGSSNSNNNKAMPEELIQKPSPPVLGRFRALLKEREDQLRDDFSKISEDDIVRIYDIVLSELTFNSKNVISELTEIAGEQRDFAKGISNLICNRIIKAPVDLKLPSLYLLDSIVKNFHDAYVGYFTSRLHEVFFVTYKHVHPNLHPTMHHLFGTWSEYFPPSVLHQMETELQISSPNHQSSSLKAPSSSESASPRPAHGIHVNPKYLGARRQFEHATMDVQQGREISRTQHVIGRKTEFGYGEYDIDRGEIVNAHTGGGQLGLSGIAARTSTVGDADRILPTITRHLGSSTNGSAWGISPPPSGFGAENLPAGGRVSHSHYELDDEPSRMSGPRALVDAYGNYRGKNTSNENHPKLEPLHLNSINSEGRIKSWQTTEEEEFVWEDMSPTLADRNRNSDSMPFRSAVGSSKTDTASGRPAAPLVEPNLSSILDHGRGSMGKSSGLASQSPGVATQIQGPTYSQDSRNLQPQYLQHGQAAGRAVQMSFSAPAGQRMPSLADNNYPKQPVLSQPQLHKPQHAREGFISSIPPQVSSHFLAQPLNHGHPRQGYGSLQNTPLLNQPPFPSYPMNTAPNNTPFQFPGRNLPPLPLGFPPPSSQLRPPPQNMAPIPSYPPPGSNGFGGLISSLMSQGLISLGTPTVSQDSVGVDFDPDVLKVRHESAIKALYNDLPRQCTTCGLRFKCQEEHSSHMDWHVTKNRTSKNRKQQPSRKWFVSTNLWLSGAETVGTEAVPGFLPVEAATEKKDDEEMAVPADENQTTCGLCGESFDDFYSDEHDEWMYRGAVYLNSLDGSTQSVDRSLLGPIVHAKCRSGSTAISSQGFGKHETERIEDGRERKRMRV